MPRTKKTTFGPRETQRIIARRKKWVDALRSGKFQQTQKILEKDGKFCCLGVANKVCNLGVDTKNFLTLSHVREKLGLGKKDHTSCWEMNDAEGKSFSQIADVIETMPIVKED
jgi:hypothetical protein